MTSPRPFPLSFAFSLLMMMMFITISLRHALGTCTHTSGGQLEMGGG